MQNTHGRIALLAGVSIAALGITGLTPTAALAAPHDGRADGTYAGTSTSANTLTICTEADTCFSGIIDTTPPSIALVNTTANGQIYQHGTGATVDLSLVNDGSAEVGAIAVGGPAATASLASWPIRQDGFGTDVTLNVDNEGTLLVDALATATGAAAVANAHAGNGPGQFVDSTATTANVTFTNNGTYTMEAVANATATGGAAAANANVDYGFWQDASSAGNVSEDITNNGTFNVLAIANASGTTANANADVNNGITQFASATGTGNAANLTFTNSTGAALHIGALANATGDAADASAEVTGIEQFAEGNSGADANATIANAGTITIDAIANASGGVADADASVVTGIYQSASASSGGDASVSLTNDGTLTIAATANATGTARASANASVETGIYQSATASSGGNASVSLANTSDLTINAIANANGGTTEVSADATIETGIYQSAEATNGGNASVSLTNDGTLTIDAVANAIGAGATFASADASVETGIYQYASASNGGTALETLSNSGTLSISAAAQASAGAGDAFARASIESGIYQSGFASNANHTVSLANDGTLNIEAVAKATAPAGYASASASISDGIYQSAHVHGTGNAAVTLANGTGTTATGAGVIDIGAVATAVGASASAQASIDSAISQFAIVHVGGNGDASDRIINDGSIDIHATANATGATSAAFAYASNESAIYQSASATNGNALASIENNGSLTISASANAVGATYASATAAVSGAIYQFAYATNGNATATLVNDGTMAISANAAAQGSSAFASAVVAPGISQSATAVTGEANVSLVNSGTLDISANAHASASAGNAFAGAFVGATTLGATGGAIHQNATGSVVTLDNSGTMNIAAVASATGVVSATAAAVALGASQHANGGTENFTNEAGGTFGVSASANANASTNANAIAVAFGVHQAAEGGIANFVNDGAYDINAVANASAASGTAAAVGLGYLVSDTAGLGVSAVNGGTMTVAAVANAPNGAIAAALGIVANASGTLAGAVTNSGTMNVTASANGGTTSAAIASGIVLNAGAGSNTATVTNSGTLNVSAVTGNGGTATAIGVHPSGAGAAGAFTFTNDGGTIMVRQSTDGGASWQRGMAVTLADTANPSVINLVGDGNIYGNIDTKTSDTINVASGTTYFDGIINPEFLPAGGVTDATLDSGLFGEGTLNINAGGNLELADPRLTGDPTMYDGPAYAFINTLNMDPDGAITFQLQPSAGGTQPVGTYPQVFADVANIDGTLFADISPANGLFADSYFWDNVIDANTINGTFSGCALAAPYATTPLLSDLDCTVDTANGDVDLGLTRVAFNAAGLGLTRNELAVATAIENVYDISLTGPFARVVAELFTLDPAHYFQALDQMSGVEYPNYLHDVRNNQFVLNTFVSDQLDCSIEFGRGVQGCRDPRTGWRVWGLGTFDHGKLDSNPNAIGYKADNWSGTIGFDYLAGNFSIGVFGGYRDLKVDYPDSLVGSRISANGWNVGLDATYDVGSFYVRGIGSYAWLNGDSRRDFHIGGLTGSSTGDPDLNVWSFYGEAGARFDLGSSWITPYVAIDYTSMHLKAFEETGGIGARLGFDSQTEHQTSGVVGLKWAGNWGGIVPEAKVAYRYDFNRSLGVDEFFVDAPAGADFRKEEDYKRGSILAGVSLAGAINSALTGRIGYLGQFNSDYTDHAVYGSLVLHFGGPVAPPPPPPPPPAPPPPPPPATQTCPDGTVILATDTCPAPPPPPPPPAPAPERGF